MFVDHLGMLSARQQAMCACISLCLCAYLCYTWILGPQLMELQAVRAKLDAQRELLAAMEKAAAEQVSEEKERDSLREQLERSDVQFFSPSEPRDFLAGLDALAKSAKCKLVAIDLLSREEAPAKAEQEGTAQSPRNTNENEDRTLNGEPRQARHPVKICARVSMVGIYPDIIQLLEAIGARPQTVHVSQLTMELVSVDASELNASFVLTIFVLEGDKENA